VGNVTLKSNNNKALSDESLLKRHINEVLEKIFFKKIYGDEALNAE
jgi:hypothetical protein